jgi:hypothetical protein
MIRSLTALIFLTLAISCSRQKDEISLAGNWQVCLDSLSDPHADNPGSLNFPLTVTLPGTLDSAGIGTAVQSGNRLERKVMLHLQRKVSYIGPAYYRKEISIPPDWTGKQINLKLERVLWESIIWIDGKKAGNCLNLSTPHEYDLTGYLPAGRHTLIICIDNSRKFILNRNDMAHAYTEETQIKWNGMLGEISLRADDRSRIEEFSVYPYFAGKSISGKVSATLPAGEACSLNIEIFNGENARIAHSLTPVTGRNTGFRIDLPEGIKPWNEFSPELYRINASLLDAGKVIRDSRSEKIGFRDLESRGNHIYLNGERLFLRGTLECCIFPLTGHPPLDTGGWEKVLSAAREYGLNHIRFHSWCPPEAAFLAADKLGMFLQVELPNWSLDFGADTALVGFINREADNIISAYGNHPSFLLMSMGNELQGDFDLLTGLVTRLKTMDPRHLYTTTTYSFQKGHGLYPETVDDFYITQNTEKGWIRGQGVFDQLFPDFKTDYTLSIDHIKIPVISHEIGQYSVFPDMKEIGKYQGVLVPANFIAVQNDLKNKGLAGDRAEKYTAATGKFATLLYKEEIERALKTDGLSGFQLLDLRDFPGQGTALVGVLNAFWGSKGFTSGEEWRMFCGEVVPLLWFEKAVYTTAETFSAGYGVANYYQDFNSQKVTWKITGAGGTIFRTDSMLFDKIPKGNTTRLGSFTIPLAGLPAPAKYQIEVGLGGTPYRNRWNIWVYGAEVQMPLSQTLVTSSFDEALIALEKGEKVLLNPGIQDIEGVEGKFVPVFWSPVHFPNQPGTMGLLMDPAHPALENFPTDFHSNWQWWDLCKKSKTLVLDSLPIDPIVSVIDNFFKNRRLGNIFEAKVGPGKLIFCSVDLQTALVDRPAARQMKYSLLKYMGSKVFNPVSSLDPEKLLSLRSVTGRR